MNLDIANSDIKTLNKYELLNSRSIEVKAIYESVFKKFEGSVTTVIDNDSATIFNVAINELNPNDIQLNILNEFKSAFKYVESCIDPARLKFQITKTVDGDICINRTSELGISKFIVHDDGLIAYSFVAFKGVNAKDTLEFYEDKSVIDYEKFTYRLFA